MSSPWPGLWVALGVALASGSSAAPGLPDSGLLFFETYPYQGNTESVANLNIAGALLPFYWSEIEEVRGERDWSALDARIAPWIAAGKCVALRIMWAGNGAWRAPAASRATPQWVFDAGAAHAFSEATGTQVALMWDPVYLEHALDFLGAVAARYDGAPGVLFVDVSPGGETNPYRGSIGRVDPDFRSVFLDTPASDGNRYSDELWLRTVKRYIGEADERFVDAPLLVTLNSGALSGRSPFVDIGDYCVERGLYVGQNGLNARSYRSDSPRRLAFLRWGEGTRLYFEMVAASGERAGSLMDIMLAAERVGCDYLGVYPQDVLRGTPGCQGYAPAYEEALRYGAEALASADPSDAPAPAAPESAALPGLSLSGEAWVHEVDELRTEGILLKPDGAGPFPAVIISHGKGGSAQTGTLRRAREMVQWGYVCIGADYTHSSTNAPDYDWAAVGARPENLRRARVCMNILRSLPCVDPTRICAFGHSMGAFVTIALAAEEPELVAAAITAGGVAGGMRAAPGVEQAEAIRVPFLIVQGADDETVAPATSLHLKQILDANGVANERHVFPDVGHSLPPAEYAQAMQLIRAWFDGPASEPAGFD